MNKFVQVSFFLFFIQVTITIPLEYLAIIREKIGSNDPSQRRMISLFISLRIYYVNEKDARRFLFPSRAPPRPIKLCATFNAGRTPPFREIDRLDKNRPPISTRANSVYALEEFTLSLSPSKNLASYFLPLFPLPSLSSLFSPV